MKKKIMILLLCSSCFLTGCSNIYTVSGDTDLNPKKIHINFQSFTKTNTNKINTTYINEIDMTEFTNEEIIQLKQIISTIYDNLGNYDYVMSMIGNSESYYEKVKDYFSADFYNIVKNGNNNYIQDTMTNIYKINNCGYYKTNIIEIKKENNNEFKVIVQVLAIQNNEKLYAETEEITFTNDLKIINIKKINDLTEIEKSTTPINENNITDSNKKFKVKLNALLVSISNKYIYENYDSLQSNSIEYKNEEEKKEKEKEINLQIKTFLEKDNFDIEVLKNLFLIGEGKFEDYGIISYKIQNTDNTEESIYKVGFVHDKKIFYFNFTYSRLLDQIINIEKC